MSSEPLGLRATLSADGKTVTLGTPGAQRWSETFPPALLPNRIAFYSALRDREKGKYAHHYAPTVQNLLRVQKIHQTLHGEAP
jgi:hypothetical protein